jgi:hypothetical protein
VINLGKSAEKIAASECEFDLHGVVRTLFNIYTVRCVDYHVSLCDCLTVFTISQSMLSACALTMIIYAKHSTQLALFIIQF